MRAARRWFTANYPQQEANAHLIAAAPTLLRALKDLLSVSEIPACLERERAVAAIASAEGRDASR